MAATNIQVTTPIASGIYLVSAGRRVRIKFSNIDAPGAAKIELCVFYSYDVSSKRPAWKPLSGAVATAKLCGRTAEFFLDINEKEITSEHTVPILLPRPNSNAGERSVLPDLAYVIRVVDGDWIHDGRLALSADWNALVYRDAVTLFERVSASPLGEFVPSSYVFERLKNIWDELLGPVIRASNRVPEESDGVHFQPALPFTADLFLRLLRIAHVEIDAPTCLPSLIPRRMLCGSSAYEGAPIMRVFYTLMELIGRSRLVRQLYVQNLLLLCASDDTIEFVLGGAVLPPCVFVLRLPRSVVHEPAIVADMYSVDQNNHLVPVRPSPYISMSQLERAEGDPMVAFTKHLDSTNAPTVKSLSWDRMLRYTWTRPGHVVMTPPTPFIHSECAPYLDDMWWSSSRHMRAHN